MVKELSKVELDFIYQRDRENWLLLHDWLVKFLLDGPKNAYKIRTLAKSLGKEQDRKLKTILRYGFEYGILDTGRVYGRVFWLTRLAKSLMQEEEAEIE